MINTVFFGLQLKLSFFNLVYLDIASTFGSTEPSSSTEDKDKNHRQFWYEKGKVKVLSLLWTNVSVPPFLVSSAPPRPWVPPYWGQGLLFWLCVKAPISCCSPELLPDLLLEARPPSFIATDGVLTNKDQRIYFIFSWFCGDLKGEVKSSQVLQWS